MTNHISGYLGHMTEMADTLTFMVKPLQNILLHNERPMTMELGMWHLSRISITICSKNDHTLTLTYFKARLDLVLYVETLRKPLNRRNLQ